MLERLYMAIELPSRLQRFILQCIPTLQAAEVLLFVAAHPERDFSAEEIVALIRPTVVTAPAVVEYMALLQSSHVVTAIDGRFRYTPRNRRAGRRHWRARPHLQRTSGDYDRH